MSSKRGRSSSVANCVKVTIIETQFVTTDKANFKLVVQKLTGKDSPVVVPVKVVPERPPTVGREVSRAAGTTGGSSSVRWPAADQKWFDELLACCNGNGAVQLLPMGMEKLV